MCVWCAQMTMIALTEQEHQQCDADEQTGEREFEAVLGGAAARLAARFRPVVVIVGM